LVDNIEKKTWGKQGVFGTTEKRFNKQMVPSTVDNPGPGQYKPEKAVKALDSKKTESNIKRSSSMFLSGTIRNPYENKQGREELFRFS
jgi:hypothetical protein